MSLSTKVLLGLGLGVLTGLFFGESVAFLDGAGRVFVVLLQMTVLPYVSVALIRSLGSLSMTDARAVARNAGRFLLVIWGLTLAVVVAFPLAFPDWQAASFFSTSLVEEVPPFDPVALYLPANPFHAFASGVVPAVVVFSVAMGLALMGIDRKQALIESLRALEDALQRIAAFVVSLAPYGVFAIAGNAAGTMRADELLGLQVYAAAYVVAALVLAFWVLPVLVTSLTPFKYAQVVGDARAALLTAFATGSVFVVLPLLAQHTKDVLESRQDTADGQRLVDVIVPIAFTLSSAGKLLSLAFVLFAGWLSGFSIPLEQMPSFLVSGVFSFFASTTIAIPFLLDLFRVPADTFDLFLIADNVVGNRFGSMLAAIHILALTLLGACGAAGVVRSRTRNLARWGMVAVVLVLGGLGLVRVGFDAIDRPYEGYRKFVDRPLLFKAAPVREVDRTRVTSDDPGSTLERIGRRGSVRVGWMRDVLPFVFRNEDGVLVGFDVEMAHALAHDLGVDLELVELDGPSFSSALDSGAIDIVMTGVAITPRRLMEVAVSDPYLNATLCFIVTDHRRDEFGSREAVRKQSGLRVGIPDIEYYAEKVERYLPAAEVVRLSSPREFFRTEHENLDALVFTAEAGSAWTLIYPQFSVAVPHPDVLEMPMGYVVRQGDSSMMSFLNRWIVLKKADQTIDRLFDYWIRGIDPPGAVQPRWSILHDVLGWGGRRAETSASSAGDETDG